MSSVSDKNDALLKRLAELAWSLDSQGRGADSRTCTDACSALSAPSTRDAPEIQQQFHFMTRQAELLDEQGNDVSARVMRDACDFLVDEHRRFLQAEESRRTNARLLDEALQRLQAAPSARNACDLGQCESAANGGPLCEAGCARQVPQFDYMTLLRDAGYHDAADYLVRKVIEARGTTDGNTERRSGKDRRTGDPQAPNAPYRRMNRGRRRGDGAVDGGGQ